MKYYQVILYGFIFGLFACQSEVKQSKDYNGEAGTDATKTAEKSQQKDEKPNIIFFGNSLTAGFGLEPEEAYPQLIQNKLDSLGYNYEVVNAGLSGETTAGGVERIDWILKQPVDVFVLELGGNDGLRGIDPKETEKNLGIIIDKVRKKYPKAKILLTGMETPPNMGQNYVKAFREVFPRVAQKKEVALMEFLLKDVGGIAALNQPDGIHPTAEGQKIVAENVWVSLRPLLEKISS